MQGIKDDFIKESIKQGRWCNCFNFPFQMCDECKVTLYDYKEEMKKFGHGESDI